MRCQTRILSGAVAVIFLALSLPVMAEGPPYAGATFQRQSQVHTTYGPRGIVIDPPLSGYEWGAGYDAEEASYAIEGILRSGVVVTSQSTLFLPGGVGLERTDAIRIPFSPQYDGWYDLRVTTIIEGEAYSIGNDGFVAGAADGSFTVWAVAQILDDDLRRGVGDTEHLCSKDLQTPWDILTEGVVLAVVGAVLDAAAGGFPISQFVGIGVTLSSATTPTCATPPATAKVFEPGGAFLEAGHTYHLEISFLSYSSSLTVGVYRAVHVGYHDYELTVTEYALEPVPPPSHVPVIGELTASPNPVAQGHLTTLVASDVVAPGGGAIVAVEFYRDVNADGAITLAVDEFLGQGSYSGAEWLLTRPASWAVGIHSILARATTDVGQGEWGPVASLALLVHPAFHTITASAGSYGSISPSGSVSVPHGGDRIFTADPDSDYDVDKWYLDGSVVQTGLSSYTISDVQANHTLWVTFQASEPGSEITVLRPNGAETYMRDTDMNITWHPEPSGGQVRIDLYKAGLLNHVVSDSTYNDGSFCGYVPYDQELGADYRVRVSSLSSSAWDESDDDFEIVAYVEPPEWIDIHDVYDLQAMCSDAMHPPDGRYRLVNDIDARVTHHWHGDLGFQPIGTGASDYFRGVLDGQGYRITDLWIERFDEEDVGLFRVLENGGEIRNITLDGDHTRIYGRHHVGALVAKNSGTITNCHSSVPVRGYDGPTVGGLVADNRGTVRSCSVSGYVRGEGDILGGLVGVNGEGGGTIGTIEYCSARCEVVRGDEDYVGGLVGWNYDIISESYAESPVDGENRVGGLVGYNDGGSVTDSYYCCPRDDAYTPRVYGDYMIGGMVGYQDGGTLERCYVAGPVFGYTAGALVGRCYGALSWCFWDLAITGIDQAIDHGDCGIGTCCGLPTAEMKQETTFTTDYGADWDFANVWRIEEGVTYPQLRNVGDVLPPPGGLTASTQYADGVHLSWNAVPEAGVYRVHRAETVGGAKQAFDWTSETTAVDDTAEPGVTYYYWVTAAATVSGTRESEFSDHAVGSRTLSAPTGVAASDGLPGFVLVCWDIAPLASYYHVYRSDSAAGPKTPLGTWQSDQSVVDAPPTPDTFYYYWVTAATDDQGDQESDFGGPDTGFFRTPCDEDADCNDDLFCNGAEMCQVGVCVDGPDPCIDLAHCDELNDMCICLNDSECDDGQFCNGVETCDVSGHCQPGTSTDCNDGVSCTVDSCNEGTDSCDNVPFDGVCDNGLYCDGAEWCDPVADCQPGTDVDCSDGVDCTVDSCNEGTDSCDNIPDDALCGNGLWCDGTETCDPVADCQPGAEPCIDLAHCDEENDVCICTGDEDCDDHVGCTIDMCNTNGICIYTPDDSACSNDLFCDGVETCDPVLDCQDGTPPCSVNEICDDDIDECLPDCNTNGVPDDEDIAAGTSQDVNSNGIPDECDECLTDADCPQGQTCNQTTYTCVTQGNGGGGGGGGGGGDGGPHPADKAQSWDGDCTCATCEDDRIEMCEAIGYAAAFFRGDHDDEAGAMQGLELWMSGELYHWDDSEDDWVPGSEE